MPNIINQVVAVTGEPTGTIVFMAGQALPGSLLLCDGAPVDRVTYAALFNAIGIKYGGGDGINTFNLPNTGERFIRATDLGRGIDPSRVNGSFQSNTTKRPNTLFSSTANSRGSHSHSGTSSTNGNHRHSFSIGNYDGSGNHAEEDSGSSKQAATQTAGTHAHSVSVNNSSSHVHGTFAYNSGSGDIETRPVNVSFLVGIVP